MNESSLRKQTLLRLVLLVALAFGVLDMHTLGHPPDLGSLGAGHMTTAAHKIRIVPAAEQGHDDSHGHGDGLHAFTACLAVLGGVLALSSLSVLRQRRWDLCMSAGQGHGRRAGVQLRLDAPSGYTSPLCPF